MPLMKSWVPDANDPDTPFPLNNLPCGVFSAAGKPPRCGVAIGGRIVDVTGLEESGVLCPVPGRPVFGAPSWNAFMAAGPKVWAGFRDRLIGLLGDGADGKVRAQCLRHSVALAEARMHLPIKVAEYTDFYSGRHHAMNVGTIMRGAENALPPNWLHMPIGYNGRASTVVVSGTDVTRPWGQLMGQGHDAPAFLPCRRFDFELELGAIVGQPSNGMIPVRQADDMIFGHVLLNDWSARDIQGWEYQPLGPFQSKAAATTISPWIVTRAALEPFRTHTPRRERPLLPYLHEPGPMLFDIALKVGLTPQGGDEAIVARTNYARMYYSPAQQLAHHASSGCAMNVADLLGSGTISGPGKSERGSLLELGWAGQDPLVLDGGVTRCFLEDGDRVRMTGAAQGDGYRIGFGDCTGTVQPAVARPRWA